MKTIATVGILALLTSCTALDIDEARLGASLFDITATDEGTIGSQAVKSTADGDGAGGFIELTNVVDRDTSVGLRAGYSLAEIEAVDFEQFEGLAVARQYLTDPSAVRLYVEGRAGYARIEVRDDFLGSGGADAFKVGGGLGVELGSVFVQVDYDGLFGNDFDAKGPSLSIGGVIRF